MELLLQPFDVFVGWNIPVQKDESHFHVDHQKSFPVAHGSSGVTRAGSVEVSTDENGRRL